MTTRSLPFAVVVCALFTGCTSANFEVGAAPTDDAALEVLSIESPVSEDSGVPSSDTFDDSSAAADAADGPLADGCYPNGCGGCTALAKPPGAACGICGTSTFACTGPTSTACAVPDDRSTATHAVNKGADRVAFVIAPLSGAAVAFAMPRSGSLTSVSLSLERSDVSDAGVYGDLRARIIKGAPSLTPGSASIVATAYVPALNIPTSVVLLTISLPSTLPSIAADEPLWIELTSTSENSGFALFGTSSGSEPVVLERTTTGYVRISSTYAYLTLGVKACW